MTSALCLYSMDMRGAPCTALQHTATLRRVCGTLRIEFVCVKLPHTAMVLRWWSLCVMRGLDDEVCGISMTSSLSGSTWCVREVYERYARGIREVRRTILDLVVFRWSSLWELDDKFTLPQSEVRRTKADWVVYMNHSASTWCIREMRCTMRQVCGTCFIHSVSGTDSTHLLICAVSCCCSM